MPKKPSPPPSLPEAEIRRDLVTDTLERNYMLYAMSVIVSRAIPEIDGLKPSHRKLLYTMYKAGLLTGGRTKSANVVGSTMRLNPHGEGAIYETMVRLSRGNEALLHPLVDSKGNFGKVYSRDMAYAASRYTEVKLDAICREFFQDIDQDTVDFVDNYDNTMKEPTLLPTTFPHILTAANLGIAVGMASSICGFNLAEVCAAAAAHMKNPDCNLLTHLPGPDFSTGGELLYDPDAMAEIYRTGRGSFKLRARWRFDKAGGLIEIYEIPYTTTVEAIIDKLAELIKAGKIKDILDVRDETDLGGLKMTLDLRRGADPEKVMRHLFRYTPLCDSFACNFNVLIEGTPRQLGVGEILTEWEAWRTECVRRRLYFDAARLREKLHLLRGLSKILLDIDRAIAIIRETEDEAEVVPNLMIGFGIDEKQAEYVADIRLRDINRAYILRRIREVDALITELAKVEETLSDKKKIRELIERELRGVAKKYAAPRRTALVSPDPVGEEEEEETTGTYPVRLFLSRHGYLKKITPLSLRMSGAQKWKEDDELVWTSEGKNIDELMVFTTKQQVYKTKLTEFEDTKASQLGDWLPGKLDMEPGEQVAFVALPGNYSGSLLFFFENGKVARVALSSYATTGGRRRLTGAYSDKARLTAAIPVADEAEFLLTSSAGKALIFHTGALPVRTTRTTQGVAVMNLAGRQTLVSAERSDGILSNTARYRVRNIPASGVLLRPADRGEIQTEL